MIAGGSKALLEPVENAEDNIKAVLEGIDANPVSKKDVIIALAASGNTPFTCKVLEKAKLNNALTVSISNNPYGEILKYGDHKIILNTKEELIAGSTRLKAGTAQKILLSWQPHPDRPRRLRRQSLKLAALIRSKRTRLSSPTV